jgi:hypothetical protein
MINPTGTRTAISILPGKDRLEPIIEALIRDNAAVEDLSVEQI